MGIASRLAQAVSRQGQDAKVLGTLEAAYRDYVVDLDRKEAVALLEFYRERAKAEDYPKGLGVDFENFATMDIPAYVNYLFDESAFTSFEKLSARVKAGDWDKLWEDPAVRLANALSNEMLKHYPGRQATQGALREGSKAFTAGLMEWEKGKPSYPDANSTMRLTYGHVLPYSPKDAVPYKHYSTVKGVLEKEDPTNPEVGLFELGVVGNRVLLFDTATAVDYFALEEHRLGEHGLTGVGGADEDHVADFVSSVAFHCNDIGLLFLSALGVYT